MFEEEERIKIKKKFTLQMKKFQKQNQNSFVQQNLSDSIPYNR